VLLRAYGSSLWRPLFERRRRSLFRLKIPFHWSDAMHDGLGQVTTLPKPRMERSDGYMKLLSFVVSNARKGEIMAIENYSEMVHLMPDTDAKIETVNQAKEECKHILLLEKLAVRLGFGIDDTMVEPQWESIRASFHEAVRKKDLPACLIIQDLMVESLAIGLYKVFASAANEDHETTNTAAILLADELEHLDIGVRRIQAEMKKDPEAVNDALIWAHNRVMPALFEMIHQSCDFLCDTKNLDCTMVEKPSADIDLELLKITALEHYVAMLEQAAFDPKITNQLIAGMASYEVPGRVNLGLDFLRKH
jgi:fatty aldehyde decarbonylase